MLENQKLQDLQNLYLLFNRVPETLETIAVQFTKFIEQKGTQFIEDQVLLKQPVNLIQKIIQLKEEKDNLITNVFQNNMIFQKARDSGFRNFLLKFPQIARCLSIKCDYEFRTGIKSNTDHEIEQKLNQIISIFRLIRNKDLFLNDFQRYLVDRLLQGSTLNDECENQFLAKLKTECGNEPIRKMDKMKEDIRDSKLQTEEFNQYLQKNKVNLKIDFNIKVLTNGCWPEMTQDQQNPIQNIPELKEASQLFQTYYDKKYNQGRALKWISQEGKSEVSSTFDNKKYTFLVDNSQLLILMLFNQQKQLTQEFVQQKLYINSTEFQKIIQSLIDIKLVEQSNQIYKVNDQFKNNMIRINCVQKVSKKQDSKQDEKQNQEQDKLRDEIIDAAMVRVMKSRKSMPIHDLMEQPQPLQMKKRIEQLIERGYIARNESDPQIFIYVP